MTQGGATQRGNEQAIRPFPVASVPEAELKDLRKRINATRWPERETVTDATTRSTSWFRRCRGWVFRQADDDRLGP
jgi:hypothetical protein